MLIIEYYFELEFKLIIPYKNDLFYHVYRYVVDIIVNDLTINVELSTVNATNLLGKCWLLIARADITFLVQVPGHLVVKWKNDIPSLSYLKIRNTVYNEIAASEVSKFRK